MGVKLFTDIYAFMDEHSSWWSGWSDEDFAQAQGIFRGIAWTLVDIGWIFDRGAQMGVKLWK